MQVNYSTSGKTKAPTASIQQIIQKNPSSLQRQTTDCSTNSLLILQDVHEWQSLGTLQFSSDESQFVKELIERVYTAIPSTPNAPALPETRVFSRPLIAYMAAYLPVAPFFRA
jgi:hypothetical protein